MSKLKSIFGAYADNIQLAIDSRNDRFDPLWYPAYFGVAAPQMSLTFTSVIGASRIEAAASVVDRDSETPLRSRPDLNKLSGEIPAIKEMFCMKESDMRDYLVMQNMNFPDATRKNAIMDLIWGDTRKVGNSVYKRVDMMCLEAVSTGKISLTTTNNPDGLVLSQDLDLLMPAENKKQSTVTWDTAASAKPITDIETVLAAAANVGVSISKMLMTPTLFSKFRKTTEVLDTMKAYFYGPKPGAGFNPVAISTLDRVNEFLAANRLPIIELVDKAFGVEKDGKISVLRPFEEDNVAFIPNGQIGMIKNAVAMEEINKVENVSYAKFGGALISKWKQNEPLREWTKAEWNAMPSLEAIDAMFILEAVHA